MHAPAHPGTGHRGPRVATSDAFVGQDVEGWIAERLAARGGHHDALAGTLQSHRQELAALDARREKRIAELSEVGITPLGLEIIERIDAEREALSATVAHIEARLSEWSAGPSSDAILDVYCSIRDAVTSRIAKADGPSEVAAVLGDVLSGIWVELTEADAYGERWLKARFVLRRPIENGLLCWVPTGQSICVDDGVPVGSGIERDVLPKPDARGWFGTA